MLQLRHGVQRVTTAGSALLFDTRSGGYFTLNPTAATVLDALAETGDPDSAAASLADTYGIDAAPGHRRRHRADHQDDRTPARGTPVSTVTALPAPIALTPGEHLRGRAAIAAAHLLTAALGKRPARLHQVLTFLAHGAAPAPYAEAEHARDVVTTLSPRCGSGYGCLPRSIATALLCRQHGTWPTWKSGVRFPPLASHAWIEADGTPVTEDEAVIATFTPTLTVAPGESTP